ncbi:MAG TPA: DUF389 domain-containing protein [Caulobacterales bacterium]|nr:DUF389 domain-containing protein [Caulobacterales bacterium]
MSTGNPTGETESRSSIRGSLRAWARLLRRLVLRRLPTDEAREVRIGVEREGRLSERYVLMCALSAGIATLGLLQSSAAVVIGAMLVSPLMSPIAALGFGFASLDARRATEAAKVVGVGVGVGLVIGLVITWLSPIKNATPEIVARTTPTLLDLAVAVLSGLAGGYATVHHKGETAIGVAIATALMPPIATIGYSLAVWRLDFAGGATLLFLTNLAAISFSFALVARIRGVERPVERIEFNPVYLAAGVGAFLLLATPLALTLARVSQEARASAQARSALLDVLRAEDGQIAQLNVKWELLNQPRIDAIAITNHFVTEAQGRLQERLARALHTPVDVRLQQIVATDSHAETQALIAAALASQARAPDAAAADAALSSVRSAANIGIVSAWADPRTQTIRLLAAPEGEADLAFFHGEESRLGALGFGWSVMIVPPAQSRLVIVFENNETDLDGAESKAVDDVVWALQRWSVSSVVVDGVSASNRTARERAMATARAQTVAALLQAHGIAADVSVPSRIALDGVAARAAIIHPFAAASR